MPDAIVCPRCGTDIRDDEHLIAYLETEFHPRDDRDIYRCGCGPLAVVEGYGVAWYYPQAWLLELARKPAVADALVDEAIEAYRADHPEVRP